MQSFGLNVTEDPADVVTLRRQLRERFLDITTDIPVESVDALDQTNAVMTSLLERSQEITLNAQVNVVVMT